MIITYKHQNKFDQLGGKGKSLAALQCAYSRIPSWFAIPPNQALDTKSIIAHAEALDSELFAVRSSGTQEDGAEHSFAGQFATKLFVTQEQLVKAIEEVRESNTNNHLATYSSSKNIDVVTKPTVLVQAMLSPTSSGVAFSCNPMKTKDANVLISSVWGVGSALVSGEVNSDNWEVNNTQILSSEIANKAHHHAPNPTTEEGVSLSPNSQEKANSPSLTDDQVLEVATLAKLCENHFQCPQDIEWAYHNGLLYLLQSRPITTLSNNNDELIVWDNSNIAESYSGITSPLTFTFAQRAYENVYREFCKLLSVPKSRLQNHDQVFSEMLGHIEGHVFYNLNSWYQVLALLPGFSVNREYMEQMMGVKEPLPDEIVECIIENSKVSKLSDTISLIKTMVGLVRSHRSLPRAIDNFYSRLNKALDLNGKSLAEMPPEGLIAHYNELERKLLTRWDAPLINDFLAMIFYGVLGKLCTKWFGQPSLQNTLLLDCGDIISSEPPKRLQEMASILRARPDLLAQLEQADDKLATLLTEPKFANKYHSYITKFGDRCMEELKLESKTLTDEPELLVESIIALAKISKTKQPDLNLSPEQEIPKLSWLKNKIFHWVLKHTRDKVRNRENLRFERTRLFGRVRQIMLHLGKQYTESGSLDDKSDIFFLPIDHALDHHKIINNPKQTKEQVSAYKYKQQYFVTPPDRFESKGTINPHQWIYNIKKLKVLDQLQGIGACPGSIVGKVKVFKSPKDGKLEPGEILVAQQTDPGWVVLFPAASAILVERGSLLSHSAIVAREMQIPCVVSVPEITSQLETGDLVEMNGSTGEINILQRANS